MKTLPVTKKIKNLTMQKRLFQNSTKKKKTLIVCSKEELSVTQDETRVCLILQWVSLWGLRVETILHLATIGKVVILSVLSNASFSTQSKFVNS